MPSADQKGMFVTSSSNMKPKANCSFIFKKEDETEQSHNHKQRENAYFYMLGKMIHHLGGL